MVDGKVVNIWAKGSSVRCPFCKATPKDMANYSRQFEADPELLSELSASILHFLLRVFELLCKIGFRQDFKVWMVRKNNKRHKRLFERRKKQIIAAFKAKGLNIFQPRDGGRGTSNDGNTAKRAFEDPQFFADQVGVSVQLIEGLHNIWIALACSLPICADKFQRYCDWVKRLYEADCGWYTMPPTLHKILHHGAEMIRLFPKTLASGAFNEEPQEATNRDVRDWQVEHARQRSLWQRNLDVFNRMMERSDPMIIGQLMAKKKEWRSRKEYPKEVLDMCKSSDEIYDTILHV